MSFGFNLKNKPYRFETKILDLKVDISWKIIRLLISVKLNFQKLMDEKSNVDNIIDVLMSPSLKNCLSEDLKKICEDLKQLILEMKKYTMKSEGLNRREERQIQIRNFAMDAMRY